MDVKDEAPADLLAAMQAAANRDQIAEQYLTNFSHVRNNLLPWLVAGKEKGWSLTDAIVYTHLTSIARFGDSLIARKCGQELSQAARSTSLASATAEGASMTQV